MHHGKFARVRKAWVGWDLKELMSAPKPTKHKGWGMEGLSNPPGPVRVVAPGEGDVHITGWD